MRDSLGYSEQWLVNTTHRPLLTSIRLEDRPFDVLHRIQIGQARAGTAGDAGEQRADDDRVGYQRVAGGALLRKNVSALRLQRRRRR